MENCVAAGLDAFDVLLEVVLSLVRVKTDKLESPFVYSETNSVLQLSMYQHLIECKTHAENMHNPFLYL